MRRPLLAPALLLVFAGAAEAQRNELTLEVNPFHGTLGYGRGAGGWRFGGEVGFGFPQADRVLAPDLPEEDRISDEFLHFIHLGAFGRYTPSDHVGLDAAAHVGLADLRSCSGDCWPGLFYGGSSSVMVGWRHVKLGPRLTGGWIDEPGHPTTFVLALTPLAIRGSFSW
jgi:hypothetical protein